MEAETNLTDVGVSKSFAALKSYFTPETRSEIGSNLAQLVLFAERILKVCWHTNSEVQNQNTLRAQ